MSQEKVQLALIATFKATFLPAWEGKVAWENVKFDQPRDGQWMSVHYMPADSRVATLGSEGYDEDTGLFQITLCLPVGNGEGNSRETISLLRTCFKPRTIQYDGQSVTIVSRSRSPGSTVGGFYKIPFTVSWQAHINR
jgi:hypothetical protein